MKLNNLMNRNLGNSDSQTGNLLVHDDIHMSII